MICNLFQECVFRVPGQSRGPGNWSPFGRSDSGRGSSNDVGQTESALGLKEENLVMTVGSIGVYKWGSLGCPNFFTHLAYCPNLDGLPGPKGFVNSPIL